tara:strand:+ start:412 stop:1023 length:612 start_codon:yes stop_codon:yes gene_type:complete
MKRIIFILVILIVIVYFQYQSINEINNSFEILQYDNPNKSIFENMLNDKLISVFTNIKFTKKPNQSLNQAIVKNLYYYNIPLNIDSNHSILLEKKGQTSLIKRQDKYRRLLYVVKGEKRIIIFNNEQKNNLYLKNNNVSSINIFNQDLEKYPLINKLKYVEIILRENNMLFIPYNFYFCYICDSDVQTIDLYSESVFSKFLKK